MRADILVVDDEAGPRESLRMILKKDHNVRTASGGREALQEIERQKPDLVFLDIRMPDMEGTEVLQAVKSKYPDVEVAMITAYAAVESARIAVRCGAIDYLTKPYSVAEVERIVEKALSSRRQQHDAELLTAQLAKITETLCKRLSREGDRHKLPQTSFPADSKSSGAEAVTHALDNLKSVQTTLHEDLQALRELSELGEIAAEVTHDINNLLTVILTSAQFLLRQIEGPSPNSQALTSRVSTIVKAAKDCSTIIRRIKDFTRLNVDHQPSAIDVNELIASAVDLLRAETSPSEPSDSLRMARPAKPRNVQYCLNLNPVPVIYGDEVALRNVLVNLIENSLDAIANHPSPDHEGLIELSTQCLQDFSPPWVQIQVRDNGCGMPPEVVEKATQAFFSTKKAHGTGLGLSITDKVVKRHQGRLAIQSIPGQGTTITIELPGAAQTLADEQGGKAAHASSSIAQSLPQKRPQGIKPTVILAEDEEAMRSLMALILESEGYRVLTATNGLEAWELFQKVSVEENEPLLVIADHEMPGMTGRELGQRIKQFAHTPTQRCTTAWETPVIIVSGYLSPSTPVNPASEDAIIIKPFDIDEFIASVASYQVPVAG